MNNQLSVLTRLSSNSDLDTDILSNRLPSLLLRASDYVQTARVTSQRLLIEFESLDSPRPATVQYGPDLDASSLSRALSAEPRFGPLTQMRSNHNPHIQHSTQAAGIDSTSFLWPSAKQLLGEKCNHPPVKELDGCQSIIANTQSTGKLLLQCVQDS